MYQKKGKCEGIRPGDINPAHNSKQSLIYDLDFTGKIGGNFQKEKIMPRRAFFLFLLLSLVLAACKPARQAGTKSAGSGKTPEVTAGATTAPKQPATLQLPAQEAKVPGCTVVSFLPTPDPTSLFPPITTDDWYQGPLTATVKIIEYSDFQ